MKYSMLYLVCALALSSFSVYSQEDNKTIIFGGDIYSADAANPHPEAIGIAGRKIVAVGKYQDVLKQVGEHARHIDLNGQYLMPGLIDTHAHVADAGFQTLTLEFPDGLQDAAAIRAFVAKNKDNPQRDLHGVQFYSNVPLDYWDRISLLDSVFNAPEYKNTPVVLGGADAHTGWANQAMLRMAGLTTDKLSQADSAFKAGTGLTADGKISGFVTEGAWDFVMKAIPAIDDEKISRSIVAGADAMNQFGITAWMDPLSNIRPLSPMFDASPNRNDVGLLPAYSALAQAGKLTAHVTGLALVNINAGPSIIDDVLALRDQFSQSPEFRLAGIKIFQDGVIEYPSQTAKLSLPYVNRPGYRGSESLDKARFCQLISRTDTEHLIAHFHAIGDRAVEESLDAVACARKANGNSETLHSITHLEVVSPQSYPRFEQLNVAASMQLLWAGKDGDGATTTLLEGKVPAPLLTHLYPAGDLYRHHAVIAGASDWPVSSPNPLLAIYTAVTRKGELGELPPDSERISREAMLQAYTINAAKVIGRGDEIGSISVGKSADFALFDRNLEKVSIETLRDAKVVWTMFEGRQVYQAD
ncbi:Amidohydrolase [Klebsiella variicola]|nr:amidohydrolase [Klebsiella variicola]VGQ08987.1 N-substituted formamide deformylase [Klebsiella variicola]VGQ11438.1 N-substituted formamide deformylase [Klebsiella variicola]HCI9593902.1 amidohydrolase [Klebsiella variicola]